MIEKLTFKDAKTYDEVQGKLFDKIDEIIEVVNKLNNIYPVNTKTTIDNKTIIDTKGIVVVDDNLKCGEVRDGELEVSENILQTAKIEVCNNKTLK